jgi:hypothetical protein
MTERRAHNFIDCAGKRFGRLVVLKRASVAASLAFQYGCPLEVLRKALLRDAQGRASSPLGAALDIVAEQTL